MLEIVHELFNEIDIYADHIKREHFIGEPTVHQFTARLAEEYLSLYGPRKLASFVARCQRLGPWAETVSLEKKIGGEKQTIHYSRYEYELHLLQRREKAFSSLNDDEARRYDELTNLLPESMMNKSDEELTKGLKNWIEYERGLKPGYPLMDQ